MKPDTVLMAYAEIRTAIERMKRGKPIHIDKLELALYSLKRHILRAARHEAFTTKKAKQ